MKIEFNWSIKINQSVFTGNAELETFEEIETLIRNLKGTVEILEPRIVITSTPDTEYGNSN